MYMQVSHIFINKDNVCIYAFIYMFTYTEPIENLSKTLTRGYLVVLKRCIFRKAENVSVASCGSRFRISIQPFYFVMQHHQQELSTCNFFSIRRHFNIRNTQVSIILNQQ